MLEPGNRKVVVSTDMFTEGVHFNLMYFPLKHLGYKCVIAAISDILAMNAVPTQILVSIGISAKFSVEAIDELYSGISLACQNYGVDLVGGDTTSSMTGLVINVTAIGNEEENELIYRDGAQNNDLLCVTGDLGGAYMGLQLLERENEVYKVNQKMTPQFEGFDYILQRQLKPEARSDVKGLLKELEVKPSSMIDISDGLSSELMHLCKQSNKGCKLFEETIPMDDQTKRMAEELSINPLVASLNGGEDFELLFTVPIDQHDKLKNNPNITIIGHMTDPKEGVRLVTTGGSEVALTAQGWSESNNE